MKYKSIIILALTIFVLISIAGVSAAEANDTVIASEDTGEIELSSNSIETDGLKTSPEDTPLSQANNDEIINVENDLDVLGTNPGNYSGLANEIGSGGNIKLLHDYYTYDDYGSSITISDANSVIDGNGAVIDMVGSTIRAFSVSASGVIIKNLTIKNANVDGNGGAIYFSSSGTVENCNFTGNTATLYGGAVYFRDEGNVTNCNFTGNNATMYGGAVYFRDEGNVTNCNFTGNNATMYGGAVYFQKAGNVTNCNFTGNTASGNGGAINMASGTVSNCNFTNNTANRDGGAIRFSSTGTVSNCNFTNNKATGDDSYGGAILFAGTGNVTNCNFTNNSAGVGGAIWMSSGSVENCNFANNLAYDGGAIFSYQWYSTADTCIFKSESDTFNNNVVIVSPKLNVDNFTTFYGSCEKLTFNLTTDSGMPVTNGNISISVYFKDNNSWVGNYSCLSGEGWIPDLPVGSYYANFTTEYAGFQAINRTITITIPNVRYYINVTSITTNNKTVNITAKSDIPKDILWDGKLLFILPNNLEINATYGGNGTWWAVHTFEDYGDYQVNASYAGLTNVTITNATITINKLNSTVNVDDVVLTYGETKNVTVTTEGATGITATINNTPVTVINNYTIVISGLAAGNYTLTVTTIPDGDHNPVNKTVNVTVNKAHTEIIINNASLELIVGDETIILANLSPAGAGNVIFTSSNKDIVEVDDKGNIIAQGKGQAIITVSFAGDNNYTAAENKTVTINVSLADASVTVDNDTLSLKVGETYAINATRHPDTILLDITYKSSNNAVATVNENGIVTAVGEGTAVITVEVGDDIFYVINSTNVTVTVNRIATDIASSAVSTVYNIEKNLIVTLKDADGKPLSGAKITVDLSGAKTYTTDNNGQVKVSTKGLAAKTYTAKITFNGNEKYKQSAKDVKVTVKKATPKLTAKKKTFKTKTKTKKYTITLKDNTGKAMKKVKVTLKVKGKTYKATTNSKGKATFKIKNLKKKGTFKAVITYKGNKNYNKVTKKVKIKVIVTFKTQSKGSKDKSTVKDIQRALKDHGYYITYDGHYLMIDGKYNSCTVRSIKEFQHDKGLKVTGKVDEKTARKLGLI